MNSLCLNFLIYKMGMTVLPKSINYLLLHNKIPQNSKQQQIFIIPHIVG